MPRTIVRTPQLRPVQPEFQDARAIWPFDKLSPRELEVALLMLEGVSYKEIGCRLGISPKTVDTYRKHVYERLSVDCPVALAYLAIATGLIAVPSVASDVPAPLPFAHAEPRQPFVVDDSLAKGDTVEDEDAGRPTYVFGDVEWDQWSSNEFGTL